MALFPKRQRKLSVQALAHLHKHGSVVFHHPYKIFYQITPTPTGSRSECKIVISVSKRNFKRAVDRNRIKRQIREAFRFHNSTLNQELSARNMQLDLLCLYLPHEHLATSHFFGKMESLLAKIVRLVTKVDAVATSGTD